jgi:hypothetical protein
LRSTIAVNASRDLARDSADRHAVGPVGRDLEVEHHVVAMQFEALERQAAQAHARADLFSRRRDVDELANPRERDLHTPNCSRNRRSFS